MKSYNFSTIRQTITSPSFTSRKIASQPSPLNLLNFRIILILFTVETVFSSEPIIISHSDKSQIIENRGRWSINPQDQLYDLAGDWDILSSSMDISGTVKLPFAWYGEEGSIQLRKTFRLPADGESRSWRLAVDGVSAEIQVMINIVNVESRRGHNLSFQSDLASRSLFFGQVNQITINIDNSYKSNVPPLRGSIYSPMIYGGIYRGIYLISSPLIRLNDLTVSQVENNDLDAPVIELKTEIQRFGKKESTKNASQNEYDLTVRISSETKGVILSGKIDRFSIPPQGIYQKSFQIALSSQKGEAGVSEISQYRAVLSLNGDTKIHEISSDFSVMKKDAFQVDVRCINYIVSDPVNGPMIPLQNLNTDVLLMIETGANTVKISHGMQPPHFLSECDRQGLKVFVELPVFQVPNGILRDEYFIRSCLDQLTAMIDVNGRYSCIAGWGIGNQIDPPNKYNMQYYEQLTDLVHQLDHRPVFATTTRMGDANMYPLDFFILDYSIFESINNAQNLNVNQVSEVIIGGISRLALPENFSGWADPSSEIHQAHYILQAITQAENADWCKGVIVGDFLDWRGNIPTISGPFKGTSNIYSAGILTGSRQPRPSYRVLSNHWKLARNEPLSQGNYTVSDGSILVVFGLILIFILVVTVRQNNIFRFNIQRTFASPSGFFQDIRDQRYFQTGHTLLLAIFISGSLGLTITGWVQAHRSAYAVDWITGYLFQTSMTIEWIASLFWNPLRSILFFGVISLFWLWIYILQFLITGMVMRRKCTLTQSIDLTVWSSVIIVGLLPIGLASARMFSYNLGWIVISTLVILICWAQIRLVYVYATFFRLRPVASILGWILPPSAIILLALIVLNHFHAIFIYWSFIMENIIRN